MLDKAQLENHLQKIAYSHNLVNKSQKSTYPIPHLIESFKEIKEVYNLLNEHLKLGISIHPAGEWVLDNFYAVEETVKNIEKEISLKKYKNLLDFCLLKNLFDYSVYKEFGGDVKDWDNRL